MMTANVTIETHIHTGGRAIRAVVTAEIATATHTARIVSLAADQAAYTVRGSIMSRISLADYERLCTEAIHAWQGVWTLESSAPIGTRWV